MSLQFGTDGVRGEAYTQLSAAFVYALGAAAATVLGGDRFVVGRDTRESGPDFEEALSRGLATQGATVSLVGVVPTPAVAWLCAADDVPGAMISASHNPFSDNGIKLFAAGGLKLSDAVQDEIQHQIDDILSAAEPELSATEPENPSAHTVDESSSLQRWTDAVVASLGGRRLDGTKVVLDCANGSNAAVAPDVFSGLGASVVALATSPDGRNINDNCGSTHLEGLQKAVLEHQADLGFAFDGDADRVLAVDNRGRVVDGDQIIAMCAKDMHDNGRLTNDAVVVTVMSNLGFRRAMASAGIEIVDTKVGDRYVLEALDEGNYALGGEQSGHVIFRELATTGDGLLTALAVVDLVRRDGRTFAEVADTSMTRFPQVLKNVRVAKQAANLSELLGPAVARVEADLGDEGRVLIRPSGTEPLIRVMVEASTAERAGVAAAELVAAVEAIH